MTIAVTGATGQLGRIVVAKLTEKVAPGEIVALARDPNKAADLGVAVRQADYDRPETLEPALAGVDTLLLISGSEVGKRASQHANIIAAAKAAGVGRIVYTSLLHADTSSLGLADEHRATEAALKASGIPFTLLRNGWYTENYAGSIASAAQSGTLYGSAGEGRIASATREDFAEAAVAAATDEGHVGKIYELAGDERFTLAELAAEIARQTGKPVTYMDLPEADYAKALEGAGLPAPAAQAVAGYDAETAKGALDDESRQLSALIGRPTTSLSAAVARVLQG